MRAKECEYLTEVAELMRRCPAPSPNPYDLTGYIHACRDYGKIHSLVSTILENYTSCASLKSKMGTGEIDDGYVEYCAEKADKALCELRAFIDKRAREGWT